MRSSSALGLMLSSVAAAIAQAIAAEGQGEALLEQREANLPPTHTPKLPRRAPREVQRGLQQAPCRIPGPGHDAVVAT